VTWRRRGCRGVKKARNRALWVEEVKGTGAGKISLCFEKKSREKREENRIFSSGEASIAKGVAKVKGLIKVREHSAKGLGEKHKPYGPLL